jgi:activator of 2-hydroxyglutaryl-CoA dehydratase
MGGESSKYMRLDESEGTGRLGIVDYETSGDCAAGTGSFLDQQASRMLYSVEDIGKIVACAGCSARVAGRCSVFAKSDMVHAQQKGYSAPEILKGLCEAVARNFKSGIVKGKPIVPPVLFVGAVGCNEGVVEAMRTVFKLAPEDLTVPELYAWLGAIGAALLEKEEWRKRSFRTIHQLQQHDFERPTRQVCASTDPLSLANVVLLRDRVKPYRYEDGNGRVDAYLGIDVGSVSTNLVLLDEHGELMHEIYLRTQGRPIEVVGAGLKEIEEVWGERVRIRGAGTTGSGKSVGLNCRRLRSVTRAWVPW